MEGNRELPQQRVTDDFILSISATEIAAENKGGSSSSYGSTYQDGFVIKPLNKRANVSDIELPPQITKISPMSTPQSQPKTPNELMRRRASLARSAYSKTKSRLVEPPYPTDVAYPVEKPRLVGARTPIRNSPKNPPRVSVGTPLKSPFSTQGKDEDEDEDVYKSIDLQLDRKSHKKLKLLTILIKTLALSFHVKRFFDRIQESLFHQYVLQTLSGPPFMEMAECIAKSRSNGQLSLERMTKNEGLKEEVINVEKLHKINQEKVSAWTMKGLINVIRRTKLSTISNSLDYDEDDEMGEQNKEITNEWEAKVAAVKIFNNVAKSGCKYIEEEDLLRFMKMDEVNRVFPLFEGAVETGKIKKMVLKKWVTVFEAIIFVFIMHPYDVGDRCVIDGIQIWVTQWSLRLISPLQYIESKPEHWRTGHSMQLKDIVDHDKIKMALYVTHTINFQNSAARGSRRSDLILELKKIFEELRIIYHLLPQEVHVTHVGTPASSHVA
ncbi:Mechanosensitive ion channel protein 10 [Bienertia sinuspersici]